MAESSSSVLPEEAEPGEQPSTSDVGEASAATVTAAVDQDPPKRCSEAIHRGLAEFQAGDFNAAIDSFTLALELPGKGSMRMAGALLRPAALLPSSLAGTQGAERT